MSDLSSAIRAICEEKGLEYEAVVGTIESALAAAYRKDFGQKNQNVKVEFDPETANSRIFDVKTVVEDVPEEEKIEETEELGDAKKPASAKKSEKTKKDESDSDKKSEEKEKSGDDSGEAKPASAESYGEATEEKRKFNPRTDIELSDAKMIKQDAEIGDEIITELETPTGYGRMAAQTAKQVIIQRLREAERDMIFHEFEDKAGEVVTGIVQRREGRFVLVDLGKAVGILPIEEQVQGERYNPGERIKVYIKEVKMGHKGAEIILSRISEEILKKVFYLEIPEISNGLIELKSVAREAGNRSKVAVHTDSDNVDPVGSCVGQRGARIQTIIAELGGEKVDIIEYDEDPAKFIANALAPAKILSTELNEENKKASVKVATDQLSLAIGKHGQNARLAARLTGWRIDIIEEGAETPEVSSDETGEAISEETENKEEIKKDTSAEEKEEVKEKKEKKKEETPDEEKDDKKEEEEIKEETPDEEKK